MDTILYIGHQVKGEKEKKKKNYTNRAYTVPVIIILGNFFFSSKFLENSFYGHIQI